MTEQATRSDASDRLRAKAQRLRACVGLVYDVKWREIFVQTAVILEEAAKEIDSLHSELFWANSLRDDAQAQLRRLREEIAAGNVRNNPQIH